MSMGTFYKEIKKKSTYPTTVSTNKISNHSTQASSCGKSHKKVRDAAQSPYMTSASWICFMNIHEAELKMELYRVQY